MSIPKYLQVFVLCVDDSNKPDDIGDFPEVGKLYEVEDFIRNSKMDGSIGFVLKGLYPQGKYETYRADRFRVPYEELVLN
jgi:hypothetical protein